MLDAGILCRIIKPAAGEPAVTLAGGPVTLTLTVPKGSGAVQAVADLKLGNP
ncbi:MAG: hypothetical protein HYY24_21900 [Verrucomicrobia bacterium]|nr:hypothetical protein [Verrucomicrobiota bacterium]